MNKNLVLILLISLTLPLNGIGQIKITGQVLTEEDNGALPGVKVLESGTENSTTTDIDGNYTIYVQDSFAILHFLSVGFIEREIPLNGQIKINTTLKPDVIYEGWDQKIRLYLNIGLIENPYGGQLDFLIPFFKSSLSLKSSIVYQTNFNDNHFFIGGLELYHIPIVRHRGIGLSIHADYHDVLYANDFKFESFSLETDWRSFYLFNFNLGLGHSKLKEYEFLESSSNWGILIGTGIWIPKPLKLSVQGKATFYNDLIEYQAEINKNFRNILTFLRYYNLNSFSELSVGIGIDIQYWFKYQRNEY